LSFARREKERGKFAVPSVVRDTRIRMRGPFGKGHKERRILGAFLAPAYSEKRRGGNASRGGTKKKRAGGFPLKSRESDRGPQMKRGLQKGKRREGGGLPLARVLSWQREIKRSHPHGDLEDAGEERAGRLMATFKSRRLRNPGKSNYWEDRNGKTEQE